MTSTDATHVHPLHADGQAPRWRRLAPLPGLLDDLVDQAIRARQRRVMVAEHPGQTLAALKVMDAAIDRALLALPLYGQDAARALDERIAQHSGDKAAAAVFVRISLAVQMQTADTNELVLRHSLAKERDQQLTAHLMSAVMDALRFSPVPKSLTADDSAHLVTFFVFAKTQPDLLPLALKLVGERDVQSLRKGVEAIVASTAAAASASSAPSTLLPWAHYALACLGHAGEATRQYVAAGLHSDDPTRMQDALRVCAVDTRLASDTALERGLRAGADEAAVAWSILACRYPRRVYDYAMSLPQLAAEIKVRLVAITGFMDGAIALCAELAEREGRITPAEADVLELVMGHVPVEARVEPNDRAAKSRALRGLVLQVCRQAHIAVTNDADRVAWRAQDILADLASVKALRVREGLRITADVPPFGASLLRVTHGLRQWLYVERAVYGRHAFALSALDVSRRQELAWMVADFVDEMRTE